MTHRYLVVDPMFNEATGTNDLEQARRWAAAGDDLYIVDTTLPDREEDGPAAPARA